MIKDNGGPAFPGLHPSKECHYQDAGMTLRDYFAAKAMQGICASGPGKYMINELIASDAYAIADAMLNERSK